MPSNILMREDGFVAIDSMATPFGAKAPGPCAFVFVEFEHLCFVSIIIIIIIIILTIILYNFPEHETT